LLGLNKTKKNVVKLIGGYWKRKNIFFHDSEGLRPTLGRVRETLFNWLNQDLTNKACLDLFAGTGALGFEALSRNASSCIFVEKNKENFTELLKNKDTLNADKALIFHCPANIFLKNNTKKFDVIFFDPPFISKDDYELLDSLVFHLKPKGLIYVESDSKYASEILKIVKSSMAGKVYFYLLSKN
jgi:16S rRNA (guanine966-N2)-methyltransferase